MYWSTEPSAHLPLSGVEGVVNVDNLWLELDQHFKLARSHHAKYEGVCILEAKDCLSILPCKPAISDALYDQRGLGHKC